MEFHPPDIADFDPNRVAGKRERLDSCEGDLRTSRILRSNKACGGEQTQGAQFNIKGAAPKTDFASLALVGPFHLAGPIHLPNGFMDSAGSLRGAKPDAPQDFWAAQIGRVAKLIDDARPIQEIRGLFHSGIDTPCGGGISYCGASRRFPICGVRADWAGRAGLDSFSWVRYRRRSFSVGRCPGRRDGPSPACDGCGAGGSPCPIFGRDQLLRVLSARSICCPTHRSNADWGACPAPFVWIVTGRRWIARALA